MFRWIIDLVRGMLMGAAEVVPGVSGGTIAIIVGLYQTLIGEAAHIVRAGRILVAGDDDGRPRAAAALEQVRTARWRVLLPVGIGMLLALVLGARLLAPLIDDHPVQMRALFAGLVLAGMLVPISMVRTTGPWRLRQMAIAFAAAALTFVLTGLPPGEFTDPNLLLVLVAAAVAVCALVLPGVSGSFILLSVGLYDSTIDAVNDRDWTYLFTFALGAALGLASFVMLLQWLLEHRARITLVIITGLMAGSLRALWPWQDDDRGLLAPSGDLLPVLAMFAAGLGAVLVLLLVERRFRHTLVDDAVPAPQNEARV